MKFELALILVAMFVGCLAQENNNAAEETDDIFKMANIMNIIKRLSRFQELVQQHNESLNLLEMKEIVHPAMQKGVQCFQEVLANSSTAISKVLEGVKESGAEPSESETPGAFSGFRTFQRLISLFLKIRQLLQDPEIQKEVKNVKENLIDAYQVGAKCFETSVKEGLPEDNYKLLKSLWNQAMNSTSETQS